MLPGAAAAAPPTDPTEKAAAASQKKKLKLSYEDYRNLSNLLIIHMRQEESKLEDESSASSATAGLKRTDIINW